MATIQEVAQLAGVSVGSVSRYLNGHQLKEANMKKIESAIKDLNYKENYFAKGLKSNRTMSVGLLMNNLQSMFSSIMVSTVGDELERQGYSMLLSAFRNGHSQVKEKLNFLLSRQVDGLIIFEADQEWEEIKQLKQLELPIISVNTPLDFAKVDSIVMNNRESTKNVIQKMIDYGHQEIGIIASHQTDYIAQERLKGAMDAFDERGLSIEHAHIYYGNYSKESGYKGMNHLLSDKAVTAVFVCNHNMSLGALQAIYEKGIKIGEEISFANFDYFEQSNIFYPKITAVKQPVEKIGRLVADRIVEKIQNHNQLDGKKYVMKNEIIWSNSVRRRN